MTSSDLPTRPLVGLFHHAIPPAARNAGIGVAVDGFARALQAHGRGFQYGLYCDPKELRAAEKALAPVADHISVRPRSGLVEALDAVAPAAWHDSAFDTYLPFALRDRAARPFPVTLLHHTLSYKELLHDAFLRLLLARPRPYDSIVCTSGAARGAMEKLLENVADRLREDVGAEVAYQGRLDTIPLGVDTERFQPGEVSEARGRLDLPAEDFVLLWVGRFTPIDKADLMPLLMTFRRLVERNTEVSLRLVLAGNQRPGEAFGDRLEARAEALGLADCVQVLTGIEEVLPDLYRAADIFVSPVDNPQETFGITPLEAMASGVPQVVSDWNGYREVVAHRETGLLVPTLWSDAARDVDTEALLTDSAFDHLSLAQSVVVDPAALERAVQTLIEKPELRAAMGEASRRRAVADFSWPVIVGRYEALWKELAAACAGAMPGEPRRPGYAQPRYFDVFGHYASSELSREATLQVTAAGWEVLAGAATLEQPLGTRFRVLGTGMLVMLLHKAGERGSAGASVAELLAGVAPDDQPARRRSLRHILWLVKYGYLSAESA